MKKLFLAICLLQGTTHTNAFDEIMVFGTGTLTFAFAIYLNRHENPQKFQRMTFTDNLLLSGAIYYLTQTIDAVRKYKQKQIQ